MNLLLLMTTGMSLRKWDELGQLSRELSIYQKLGETIGHVYIFSYGKNEEKYVKHYPNLSVVSKFKWFPVLKRGNRFLEPLYQYLSTILRKDLFREMDIAKTNQFYGSDFGLKLKKRFGCKLVVRMGYYYGHFLGVSKKQYKIEEKIFTNCNKIIETNQNAVEFINSEYRLLDKAICLHNYIDEKVFKSIDVSKGIDLLYIGRMEKRKNLKTFVQATIGLNLKTLFIGKGELKTDLLNFARSNNIDLTIIDRVDNKELPIYYNKAKVFVLPSFYEGNPKVLLEAMACGCAIIGTDVNGINNIIQHKVNGYLCGTTVNSIRKAISDVLENKRLQKVIGKNARKTVLETCSLENNLQKELKIYENL